MAMSMEKDLFDAQLVTKTLDRLNTKSNSFQDQNSMQYEFQKSVLQAAFTGKGTQIDSSV